MRRRPEMPSSAACRSPRPRLVGYEIRIAGNRSSRRPCGRRRRRGTAKLPPPASSRTPPSTPWSTELKAVRVSTVAQCGLRIRQWRFGRQPVARNGAAGQAGHGVGNAVVGGADHAADRLRAVAQRRRSADHFDLVGGQRIDRHEMIFAEIGDAAAADAVLDNADAIDVEAAHDRPARRARRKARSGDAGLGEQEIAERGAAAAADLLVRHDGDGGELVGDDRQHALLGHGRDGRGLRLRRRLPVLAGRCPATARRCAGRHHGFRRTIGLGAVTVISAAAWRRREPRSAPSRRRPSRTAIGRLLHRDGTLVSS